jgi:(p)ppGpp synthase/HD superfamily hydrolase
MENEGMTYDWANCMMMWDPASLPERFQYSVLARAIAYATHWHDGQVDKSGHPSIYHPLAVAYKVALAGGDETQQAAAVLHDVVEDSACSISEIYHYFGIYVGGLVESLTRRQAYPGPCATPGETYDDYIERVHWDERATLIKIADVEHNIERSYKPVNQPPTILVRFSRLAKEEFGGLVKRYQITLSRLRRPRDA